MEAKNYQHYIQILKEELVPAMGCTEPIALAYCASKCRDVLNDEIIKAHVQVSGNIIKNVKSVVVPNTGGLKGIASSIAAGIVAGKTEKVLEVIAEVSEQQKQEMQQWLQQIPIDISPLESECALDICVELIGKEHQAKVRIAGFHTNIVFIERDHDVVFEMGVVTSADQSLTDRSLLNIHDIYEFANNVELDQVKDILQKQQKD